MNFWTLCVFICQYVGNGFVCQKSICIEISSHIVMGMLHNTEMRFFLRSECFVFFWHFAHVQKYSRSLKFLHFYLLFLFLFNELVDLIPDNSRFQVAGKLIVFDTNFALWEEILVQIDLMCGNPGSMYSRPYMCCYLAGSVGSRQHWLWDTARKRNAFLLFSIVLRIV